jgi:hypothetical protein
LAAKPIQLGIEPLRIPPFEVGYTTDAECSQIAGEAGTDAR